MSAQDITERLLAAARAIEIGSGTVAAERAAKRKTKARRGARRVLCGGRIPRRRQGAADVTL